MERIAGTVQKQVKGSLIFRGQIGNPSVHQQPYQSLAIAIDKKTAPHVRNRLKMAAAVSSKPQPGEGVVAAGQYIAGIIVPNGQHIQCAVSVHIFHQHPEDRAV